MITKLFVIHEEADFFGRRHSVESTLTRPYEEDVKKAFDKFRRRHRESVKANWPVSDYLHIDFESGVHDVLYYRLRDDDPEWKLILVRSYSENSRDGEVEIEFWRYRESIAKHDPDNYLMEVR